MSANGQMKMRQAAAGLPTLRLFFVYFYRYKNIFYCNFVEYDAIPVDKRRMLRYYSSVHSRGHFAAI